MKGATAVALALALRGGSGQEQELVALLEAVRTEVGAPGAVLGVRWADGEQLVVASGYADVDADRLIRPSDPYFLGSITKTYTAVVVLRLVEEGRLSLDESIDRLLPSFPRGNEITVRHLLAHTSGLKDFYSYIYFRPEREEMIDLVTRSWTEDELLELSGRLGHWFDPGSGWSYSSTNYYLLGLLIERATGLSLSEAYRSYVYAPLGLERTWLAWYEEARSSLPTGYLGPLESWKHSEMFGDLGPTTALDRSPVEWGAGGLAAPAEDALRFLEGLFAGGLLEPQSLKAMTQFRATPPLGVSDADATPTDADESNGYGLGLIRMKRAGFTVLGHGGLFTGHTAGLWHVPKCNVTLTLYFNRGFVGQRRVLDQVLPEVARRIGCE